MKTNIDVYDSSNVRDVENPDDGLGPVFRRRELTAGQSWKSTHVLFLIATVAFVAAIVATGCEQSNFSIDATRLLNTVSPPAEVTSRTTLVGADATKGIDKASLARHERRLNAATTVTATAGQTILKGLAQGAAQKVGGDLTGWILGAVGLYDEPEYYNPEEDLLEIKDELAVQTQMLADIQAGITALSGEIDNAVEEIEKAIVDSEERNKFNTWAAALHSGTSTISGYSKRLELFSTYEPGVKHDAEIENFRFEILNKVPPIMDSIHDALVGVPVFEGMIPLFARIQFKDSRSIHEYSELLNSMFEYYYAFEVMALQLMIEAYHAVNDPEANYVPIKKYYDGTWKPFINTQIDMYTQRLPMDKEIGTFSVKGSDMGNILDLIVSSDRAYFLNKTAWVFSSKLDGSDVKSVKEVYAIPTVTPAVYMDFPVFALAGDSLLVGGPEGTSAQSINITKFKASNLQKQGEVRLPVYSNKHEYNVPRGFAVDVVKDVLYVDEYVSAGGMGYANITAVDFKAMKNKPSDTIPLGASPEKVYPGQMALVGDNTAVVVTKIGKWYDTVGSSQVTVFDTKSKNELGVINGSSGSLKTSSGLTISIIWSESTVFIAAQKNKIDGKYFALANPLSSGASTVFDAEAVGQISCLASQASSDYALVDPKSGVFELPMRVHGSKKVIAVSFSGKYLYAVDENNKVAVLYYRYPVEEPPLLQ